MLFSTADYSRTSILCQSGPRIGRCCFIVGKCKVMHFGTNSLKVDYTMDGKVLQKVYEEKHLGVVISNDLKASLQCTQAYCKANRMLGMINHTVVHKSKSIMLSLYKTLVHPHLEYCTAALSPHYAKDKVLLERVQRFIRMILDFRKLPYTERLHSLKLWSLEE